MSAVYSPDLTRARTYGAYQYTYDNPASVGPRARMQLEFWKPKGRKGGEWVPQHLTFGMTGFSKAWRKVLHGHSHADKLSHSIAAMKSRGYARSVADQIALYMTWAESRGLTRVHRFSNCKYVPPKCGSLEVVSVDPADFIGDAPVAEECDA